ncbi:uncharacterized protein LAESUDRAFT_741058 [Laetiporus sulphureus 93-53]|uniref:Uncharacterized protein n=1 Tax=Laetiporus sulphureus 93-53 TaxID=1314785 RepID=A0A165HEI2_9APHY|nr:uncharacterized protein LAESUDRAFT_741058 [Laetiporus sulphureus 93-53]KZT11632.1 hypothetical protein LAESUDRAFT_741058 [Laetiporus sulphureus 93-53]
MEEPAWETIDGGDFVCHISVPRTVNKNLPLSVLDASVVRFSPTGACWFLDAPSSEQGRKALSPDHLRASLQCTLTSYVQWTGQLKWAPYDPEGDHTQRVGRLILTYGSPADPASIVPSPASRAAGSRHLDVQQTPMEELFPPTNLPLHDLREYEGLPNMIVQITEFACGGRILSPTLLHFVHDWARTSSAMQRDADLPVLSPVFDLQRLDRAAAGDIDTAHSDPVLVEKARALPMHRYDWWGPGSIGGITAPDIPPALEPVAAVQAGMPMRWAEWDTEAPLAHHIVHFSGDEVHGMYEAARASSGSEAHQISRHDAVVAHIWTVINHARGLEEDGEAVHLNVSLGIPNRLSPPLPKSLFGSPLILTRVSATAALLHDKTHDPALVRIWHAFLGERNVIITSWVHQRAYEVDFGAGVPPRYVAAVMPDVDGCIQIMDAALRKAVTMRMVLGDPLLRKYSVS